jgi:hypothetical protein
MRHRVLIAALAVLAIAPSPASAATTRTCSLKGSRGIASNSTARVYTVRSHREDYGNILYGCLRSTGKRVRLAEEYDDGYVTSSSFDKVRLNGRFVAWESSSTDISCKADCPPGYSGSSGGIDVADLRSRHVKEYAGSPGDELVVGRGGTPAWLQTGVGGVEVHAGDQVLDTGVVDHLKLSGTTLSWQNGGQAKYANLR